MKNAEIAQIFRRMGSLLEIKGDNIFKVKAYERAAENLENLAESVERLYQDGRLTSLAGIGSALTEKIGEYLETHKIQAYIELTQEYPESLLELLAIPSVGPKMANLLFTQVQVKNRADLERALAAGKLTGLAGVKEKTIENIRRGLDIVKAGQARLSLVQATEIAQTVLEALKTIPFILQAVVSGSLRRQKETIGDIDILVSSTKPKEAIAAFIQLPLVQQLMAQGDTKVSVLLTQQIQVDLRIVSPDTFGAALLYFTGSKSFNVRLRQLAISQEKKVSEYGVFAVKKDQETLLASRTEKQCLDVLGLPFIPPELREEWGEAEFFSGRKLPELITVDDVRGDLHTHSTWSDGRNTIAEMAQAAQAQGYAYLAVTDHSPRLKVAGGVSIADLKKKRQEIDALNAQTKKFRILYGTEVEVDLEGNLDYPDSVLEEFDVVIAAIHSGFDQPREKQTARILKALSHKWVNILAHPMGVHLGKREAYDVDFEAICQAAAEHRTFLEINASTVRMDLNAAHVYYARKHKVSFVISTDAHALKQLELMPVGVAIARRGWLTKAQVLNTRPLTQVLKSLGAKKSSI